MLKGLEKGGWFLVEVATGMHVKSPVTNPKVLLRANKNTSLLAIK